MAQKHYRKFQSTKYGRGARRHGQGWALALPLEMLKSVFLLQMLSKTSVDEVFMHYFEKISSASGGFALKPPPGSCPWTLLGDFRPSGPLIAHTWKKNPAGAHAAEYALEALRLCAI